MGIKNYKFLESLAKLPFIEEIWLFGSRARDTNDERSDIDIAIICPKATNSDWLQVSNILENADTLLKIDYVRFDLLKLGDKFRDNILRYKKIIYKR